MNQVSLLVSNLYAILLILGGVFGFMKAHSAWSLVTGVISGILVLMACKTGANNPKTGYLYVSAISLILCGFFGYRFAITHAVMPAGIMLLLSTTTLVVVGLNLLKSK